MLRWLVTHLFPEFEEEKVTFKIKVRKGSQDYSSICWYKVTGYWKYSWEWWWHSLGVIEEKPSRGKWHESMRERLLLKCEEIFVHRARLRMCPEGRTRTVSMSELIPKIDGK